MANVMFRLKLRRVGNSTGLVLPKEMLKRFNVRDGDELFLTETQEGFLVTPYDPVFEEQMEKATRILKKRRNALRALAR